MYKFLRISLLASIIAAFATMSYATQPKVNAIMTVAPNITTLNLSRDNGSGSINYTVTNNSNKIMNLITIAPSNNQPDKVKRSISVASNTCTTASLAPGGQCTFQLNLLGNNNLPAYFWVAPKVCAFNGSICSIPISTNRVKVTMGGSEPPPPPPASPKVAIAVGQQAPTTGYPIIAVKQLDTNSWSLASLNNTYPTTGRLNSATCQGNSCIAAGNAIGNPAAATIAYTDDGGVTWSDNLGLSFFNDSGIWSFNGVSCINQFCIAVGNADFTSEGDTNYAIAQMSINGGASWDANDFQDYIGGGFASSSCAQTTAGDICVAAGRSNTTPRVAWTYATDIYTWNTNTSLISVNGTYRSVSCSTTDRCAAVGETVTAGQPFGIFTTDGGQNWAQATFATPAPNGVLHSVSCQEQYCVSVGYTDTNAPLAYYTDNNQTVWKEASLSLPTTAFLESVTCTTSKCFAAGSYEDNLTFENAMLAVSADHGATWSQIDISALSIAADSDFNTISCADDFCFAVGRSNSAPLIVYTENAGVSWSLVDNTASGFPATGDFNGSAGSNPSNLMKANKLRKLRG